MWRSSDPFSHHENDRSLLPFTPSSTLSFHALHASLDPPLLHLLPELISRSRNPMDPGKCVPSTYNNLQYLLRHQQPEHRITQHVPRASAMPRPYSPGCTCSGNRICPCLAAQPCPALPFICSFGRSCATCRREAHLYYNKTQGTVVIYFGNAEYEGLTGTCNRVCSWLLRGSLRRANTASLHTHTLVPRVPSFELRTAALRLRC